MYIYISLLLGLIANAKKRQRLMEYSLKTYVKSLRQHSFLIRLTLYIEQNIHAQKLKVVCFRFPVIAKQHFCVYSNTVNVDIFAQFILSHISNSAVDTQKMLCD